MKLAEYFTGRRRPIISFEIFPPKTDKAMDQLARVLPRLIELSPDYMTVTYGAFGATQARTIEIAGRIKAEFSMEVASHLTCVGLTCEKIDAILDDLHDTGVENIVALRGDPPQGEEKFVAPEGGLAHANELVEHIGGHRHSFSIAVAGYPEKHVEAADMDTDLRHLKRKVDAGADIVITQLFYDNRDYFSFVERAREAGITTPIVAGLLPIQSFGQIKRITSLCGSKIPASLNGALERAGDDVEKVKEVGIEWAVEQAHALLEADVPGIHFYVLNRANHMERIFGAIPELTR